MWVGSLQNGRYDKRHMSALPILYSFRRCPYAIRARMALLVSQTACELREVALKNKPQELILASPKATVPVLVLPDGRVIEESREIMAYALERNDPEKWLSGWGQAEVDWIDLIDGVFKGHLDRYKYPQKYDGTPEIDRALGLEILWQIDRQLEARGFLAGTKPTLIDVSIFPFVRQFRAVDTAWFAAIPFQTLHTWLACFLDSAFFKEVMTPYPVWQAGQPGTHFPLH
jgi:glutathione S-transferase